MIKTITILTALLCFSLLWGGVFTLAKAGLHKVIKSNTLSPRNCLVFLTILLIPTLFILIPTPLWFHSNTFIDAAIIKSPEEGLPYFSNKPSLFTPFITTIFLTYITVALFKAYNFAASSIRLRKIIKTSMPVNSNYVCDSRIRITKEKISPFASAYKGGTIIISKETFAALDHTSLDFIICHEQAHLKRHDPYYFILMDIIDIFFWFNIFIKKQTSDFRLAAEIECDHIVLQNMIHKNNKTPESIITKSYANALLSVLKQTAHNDKAPLHVPRNPAVFLQRNKGDYEMRITNIMNANQSTLKPKSTFIMAILISCLLPASAWAMTIGEFAKNTTPIEQQSDTQPDAPSSDRQAQPLTRIPPRFPAKCLETMEEREDVTLIFDVSKEGKPIKIQVLESTNSCFNKAAINAVKEWTYQPKITDGKPDQYRGVVSRISFLGRITIRFSTPHDKNRKG